jgi:hypothetical protein
MQINVSGAGTTKTFPGPVSATHTPVGHYMLFALKPNGSGGWLPSKMAKYVKIVTPSN